MREIGFKMRRKITEKLRFFRENIFEQECIPLGCIPSTAVAVPGGGCLPARGGCLPARPPPREQNQRHVQKHYLADGKYQSLAKKSFR